MYLLIPTPKEIQYKENFLSNELSEFNIGPQGVVAGANIIVDYSDEILDEQEYFLKISAEGIKILSKGLEGARLASQTLRQIEIQASQEGLKYLEIHDFPDVKVRGFMLDISRCKVPNMKEFGILIERLALLKYNRLELYTEHTFAFKGHEIVWANASPITVQEYTQIRAMCDYFGIELVANLNGLGHLERWLRYPQYQDLAESKAPFIDPLGTIREFPTTLYPDKNALDFMEGLYEQFLPNFTSGKFNIGGDEPWELGMGRSKELCEKIGKYELYIQHILGLRDIAKAKGIKEIYFWADVLMQKPQLSELLPEDMIAIIWGYYLDHPFQEQCAQMQKQQRRFMLASGTSTWNSFGHRWNCAKENIVEVAKYAKEYKAEGVILTNWGDGGNHQPYAAMMPAIIHNACACWGEAISEEALTKALNLFVFEDESQNFGKALLELGKIDENLKLFSYHHRIFFGDEDFVKKFLKEHDSIDFDKMELGIMKTLELLSSSSPKSPDADISLAEVNLALMMTKWAIHRARNDIAVEESYTQVGLKFIVSEFEKVWLGRARLGGMSEAVSKIKNIKPEIFR